MHKINDECYNFKQINYNNGLLDEIIDCTYVIHLEGRPKRLEQIYYQLDKYNLSKKILILFCKGFKKCNSNSNIKSIKHDLIESNFYIFEHAKNNNYNNILILEDDFLLDKKIKNINNINNIKNFFNNKKNKSFVYSLGGIPYISFPLYYDLNTWYSPKIITSHAIIFTKEFREKLLNIGLNKIIEKDMGWDTELLTSSYFYYKVLAYQTLDDTDNRKTWSWPLLNNVMNLLKLDTLPKFGFRLINYLSKLLSIFIFILFLLFIFILYKIIINNKNNRRL
jgi:hypothetical protein